MTEELTAEKREDLEVHAVLAAQFFRTTSCLMSPNTAANLQSSRNMVT